jgi:hypothetical protein
MRIISFSWATPALLTQHKTVTRRDWSDNYAKQFKKGDIVQAWDKSPRYGGKHVADIKLTCDPYRADTCDVPATDWQEEGFQYLTQIGAKVNKQTPINVWQGWVECPENLWVVRFELVRLIKESDNGR